MSKVKVNGYENLIRDVRSNAIINANSSEYQLYMKRIRIREEQSDQIRNMIKEINNLKGELREIKELIKKVIINGN
jgi:hypothetical protein